MKLSLVIPCYNEQDNVELFYNTATEVFKDKGFDYELIFVNDGSRWTSSVISMRYPMKM